MLNQTGALSVAELVFYCLIFPFTVFVGFKQGFSKTSGWYFLIALALIRIVGNAMELAVQTLSGVSSTVAEVASILSTLGLSPLTLCTIGLLKRLVDGMQSKPVPPRVFWLFAVLPIVGFALSIAGASNFSSSDPQTAQNAVTYIQVASILYLVLVVIVAGATLLLGIYLHEVAPLERRLFYAIVFSLPFLLVRCIYAVLSTQNFTNTASPFNRVNGSIWPEAFMAALEEFLIILAYVTAGILTPRAMPAAQPADNKANVGRRQRYQRRSDGQQQSGSIEV